jgi:UPF0755 protein
MLAAIRRLVVLASLAAFAVACWLSFFSMMPLKPPRVPFDFTVRSGASLKSVAAQLAGEGLLPERHTFWIIGRMLGKDAAIQAGTYRIEAAITPMELLEKLASGDALPIEIAFVEGTTLRQWLLQMGQHPHIRATLAGRTDEEIRVALAIPEPALEGLFFPDTYRFLAGTTDADILRRAYAAMARRLAQAWQARDPELPIATAYEALVLASIVEKETGQAGERPVIASVFVNRIRMGMRLQTDPTVIYGMGSAYAGNIRKSDLETDTPYNTYTRAGLPPTPIAMPGKDALEAVAHPAAGDALYFVARGNGAHYFSANLAEHNAAVRKYQLRRK